MINKSHGTRTLLVFGWIFIGFSGPPRPVCQRTTGNLRWQGAVGQKWGAHYLCEATDSIRSQSSHGQMMLSMVYYWRINSSTHWERPWCWERSRAGGEGGDRGEEGWMAPPFQQDMSLSKLRAIVKDREAWRAAVRGVAKSPTWHSDWNTATNISTSFPRALNQTSSIFN